MKQREYHWVTEELDIHGDIDNTYIDDRFPGMPVPGKTDVALVVDDERLGRAWAYVVDGKLPEWMADSGGEEVIRVPARYRKEICTLGV